MKKLNIYFSLFFAVLISFGASGQESLRGLESRPMSKLYPGKTQQSRSAAQSLSMNLPFLDDFSAKSPLPSSNLWIDADVFVNNQFGIFAPSYGVATFDALDGEGAFYTNAGAFQFSADKLTSVFVNLSTNVPSDSIYFSFFYQPQGSGNDPETKDSLVLQFMSEYRADTLINTNVIPPDTTFIDKWVDMWSSQGMPLDSFRRHNQDKWFGLVMIPVTNPVFFKNTFRFRFFNYASLASNNIPSWQANCDEWNIDYVYMNEGRTIYDTAFNDITIVNEGTSFLKNYSAMPFRQFAAAAATEMRDSTEMLISNLGTA
jgi:hypothetical protein